MTKNLLGKLALAYEEINLDESPKLQEFKDAGHLSAPVVEAGNETWSGFRPDMIKRLGGAALNG